MGTREPPGEAVLPLSAIYVLSRNMKNIRCFIRKLSVFSIYLNRRVFVIVFFFFFFFFSMHILYQKTVIVQSALIIIMYKCIKTYININVRNSVMEGLI